MMRLARRGLRAPGKVGSATVLVTATFGVLVACADSTVLGTENTGPEGGVVVPPDVDDGGADVEAATVGPDAGPDADAAIPLCSTDDFCHTVVPKGRNLVSVWGDGAGVVWALSSDGDILRWDGSAWNIHKQTGLEGRSIWGSGPTDVWVVSGGSLFRGTGATPATLVFSRVNDLPGDPNVPLTSVWGTGPEDIWVVGSFQNWDDWPPMMMGRVLHYGGDAPSSDPGAGTNWTSDEDAASMGIAFRAVWGSPTTGVWMDGLGLDEDGFMYLRMIRRPAGANEWTLVDGVQSVGLRLGGAAVTSDSSVLVSGITGFEEENYKVNWVGTSSDHGATFTWTFTIQPRWTREFLAYWGTGANDAWGVGENGLVSHWDGTKWTQAVLRVTDVPVGRPIRAIWGKSNDDFWVVGDEIALHKTNAGKP